MYDFEPNYEYAKNKAYEILLNMCDGVLPVDIFKIVKQYKNVKLVKLEDFAKQMNMTIKQTTDTFGSEEGFTIYDNLLEKYKIVYSTACPDSTIRWIVAHELGHIILGHLTSKDYDIIHYAGGQHPMEKEANCFTKHILVPFPVITAIDCRCDYITVVSPEDLSSIFNVSYTCAGYVCDHYNKLYFKPNNYRLTKLFENSIATVRTTNDDFLSLSDCI